MTARIISFDNIGSSDLIVDATYESSADGQLSGEPIARLLPGSGNMGGFRFSGRTRIIKRPITQLKRMHERYGKVANTICINSIF